VAGDEPVTSPDQHKPTNVKLARIGGIGTILALIALTFGNHRGHTEDVWLIGLAGFLGLIIVVDWVLRRNGIRS